MTKGEAPQLSKALKLVMEDPTGLKELVLLACKAAPEKKLINKILGKTTDAIEGDDTEFSEAEKRVAFLNDAFGKRWHPSDGRGVGHICPSASSSA